MHRWLPLLLLFFAPLAIDFGVMDVLDTKHALLWLCVSAWVLLTLIAAPTQKLTSRLLTSTAILVLLFVPTWVRGTPFELWYLPFFQGLALLWGFQLFHTQQFQDEDETLASQTWLTALLWGCALTTVLAVLEWNRPLWFPWGGQFNGRPVATMGNPNHLGALLAMALPLIWWRGGRWLWAAPFFLFVLGLTGSRMAWLSVAISLGLPALWQLRKHGKELQTQAVKLRRRRAWLALGACVALWVSTPWLSPNRGFSQAIQQQSRGGLSGRLRLFRCVAPMTRQALPWGIGFGRFAQRFAPQRGRCQHTGLLLTEKERTTVFHLHNDVLELLLEGGLWLLALLVAFGWWVRRKRRSATHEQIPKKAALNTWDRAWLWGVVLCFLFHASGSFPLYVSPLPLVGLFALALLWPHSQSQATPQQNKQPQKNSQAQASWVLRFQQWLCLGLALAFFYTGARQYLAQRDLSAGVDALEQQKPGAMRFLYQGHQRFPTMMSHFYIGQALLQSGNIRKALPWLHRGFQLQPSPIMAQQLQQAYQQLGQAKIARGWQVIAHRLDPTIPKPN